MCQLLVFDFDNHSKRLAEKLDNYADRIILLTGANGTKAIKVQVVEQYVGRLNRDYDGKENLI